MKYPLATVHKLLTHLGDGLGVGYDCGCKFGKTVMKSSLKDLATMLWYWSLIGLFHGHVHNRLCQLDSLGTYVKHLGLEDLETCK